MNKRLAIVLALGVALTVTGATRPTPLFFPEQTQPRRERGERPELSNIWPRFYTSELNSAFNADAWTAQELELRSSLNVALYHVHFARACTAIGQANLLALRAQQVADGTVQSIFMGYDFWMHGRATTRDAAAAQWYSAHDSVTSSHLLKTTGGSEIVAWDISDPFVDWKFVNTTSQQLGWQGAYLPYAFHLIDVLSKYTYMWPDVPVQSLFIDYMNRDLYNNVGLITNADFDSDGVNDYNASTTGWLNTTARDAWDQAQRYYAVALTRQFPDFLVFINGTSGEKDDPGLTLDKYPREEYGLGTIFEDMRYNNTGLTTASYNYKIRVDNAIARGPLVVVEVDTGNSWDSNDRAYARYNRIASMLADGLYGIRHEGVTAHVDSIVVFQSELFGLVGTPVGDTIKQDLGSGAWRYVRQFSNGWARMRFTASGTADSARFDYNP